MANLPPPTFDLDTWANNYEGALLPLRLAHVALHCPSLAPQALSLAIASAKKGKDVRLYTRLHTLAAKRNLAQHVEKLDQEWVSKQEEANRRELARLEGELRGYKNNLIRESIRMGQEDLAMHHLLTGGPPPDPNAPQSTGYNAAAQAFGKMRDYCTTPTHVAGMTLRLIYTALLQAVSAWQMGGASGVHFNSAIANAHRIRTVGVKEEEAVQLTPIMHTSIGIAYLGSGSYREAAGAFLATPSEYATSGAVQGQDFTRLVASANDIAIYGGLCALATLSRDDLVSRVLGGPFRYFLELEPHMRKAISLFTTAKYPACLSTLRHYYSDWSLDVFLGAGAGAASGSHVDRLLLRIREKSLVAHCASFSQLSLSSLAATFPPLSGVAADIEPEVLELISTGALESRLDAVNGVLISANRDARHETRDEAAKAAEELERGLLLRLHRVNVSLAGLDVPKAKNTGWHANDREGMRLGNGF